MDEGMTHPNCGYLSLNSEELKEYRIEDECKVEVVLKITSLSEMGGSGDVLSYKILSYPDSMDEAMSHAKRSLRLAPYPS